MYCLGASCAYRIALLVWIFVDALWSSTNKIAQITLNFLIWIQFSFCRPDIAELELKLSEYTKKMSNLQQMVQELASKV